MYVYAFTKPPSKLNKYDTLSVDRIIDQVSAVAIHEEIARMCGEHGAAPDSSDSETDTEYIPSCVCSGIL